MIRGMLLESCRPDWDFATRLCSDLQSKLDEDTLLLLEQSMVRHWLEAMLEYEMWFVRACTDYSMTASDLLDPPTFVFRPDRKDQLHKFFKYGWMFRSYDLIRQREAPLPLLEFVVRSSVDVVQCALG